MSSLRSRRGGEKDRDDLDPVIEVVAEGFIFHPLDEVLVGRRDDPHVDLDVLGAADAAEGALLEDSQELGLHAEVHVADLVEEDGPAVGGLEETLFHRLGVGESPLFVPHQLAFKKRLGDGGAVDGHEGFVGPGAFVMNGLGDQLLAGAALPLNQDGAGIAAGDLFHHGQYGVHVAVGADDVADAVLARLLGTQVLHLALELAGFESLFDDDGELVEIEGLVDVVVGPHAHRLDGGLKNAEGGHHDDGGLLLHLLDPLEDLEAADSRKLDIEEHQIRRFFAHQPEGVFTGTGGKDLIPLLLEILLQGPANQMFVVDDQNFIFAHDSPRFCLQSPRPRREAQW
ncbi:hypothetical protein DSOUD_0660 [Desulfuromonas soudanensis]|uniref:Uncharacterized protein n=1 Tax=Desulfuromonas soudanensis TaxID=1603606 RepID=A0A0M5IN39_9BACT|nr:hypothetical protein DSOUD_0660 [Desulfuromonas soudanensis]